MVTQEGGYRISLPWWSFVALRNQLLQVFKGYGIGPDHGLAIGASAASLLKQSKRAADGYNLAKDSRTILELDLRARLSRPCLKTCPRKKGDHVFSWCRARLH